MPLAAIITDKTQRILCCHGGIGPSLQDIDSIDQIQRPISIKLGGDLSGNHQKVVDILWSDPKDTEDDKGFSHNFVRDP